MEPRALRRHVHRGLCGRVGCGRRGRQSRPVVGPSRKESVPCGTGQLGPLDPTGSPGGTVREAAGSGCRRPGTSHLNTSAHRGASTRTVTCDPLWSCEKSQDVGLDRCRARARRPRGGHSDTPAGRAPPRGGGVDEDAAPSRYLRTCLESHVEETAASLYSGKLVGEEELLGIVVFFRNGRVNSEVTSCRPEC